MNNLKGNEEIVWKTNANDVRCWHMKSILKKKNGMKTIANNETFLADVATGERPGSHWFWSWGWFWRAQEEGSHSFFIRWTLPRPFKTKPARAIQLQSHFTFYDPQNFLLNPLLESPTQTALSIVNLLTTFTFNFSYSLVNLPRASSLYGSTSNLLFSFTFTF